MFVTRAVITVELSVFSFPFTFTSNFPSPQPCNCLTILPSGPLVEVRFTNLQSLCPHNFGEMPSSPTTQMTASPKSAMDFKLDVQSLSQCTSPPIAPPRYSQRILYM
jgi:hypothetical protein